MAVIGSVLPIVLSEGVLPRFIEEKTETQKKREGIVQVKKEVNEKLLNVRLNLLAFSKKMEMIEEFFKSIERDKKITLIDINIFFQAFNNACNMNKTAVNVFLEFAKHLPIRMKSTEDVLSKMLKDAVGLEREQYHDCLNLALLHCPPEKIKEKLFLDAIWASIELGSVENLQSIFEVINSEKIFLTKPEMIEFLNLTLFVQEKKIFPIFLEQLANDIVWPVLTISDFSIILECVDDVEQIEQILLFIQNHVISKIQISEDGDLIGLVQKLILTASKAQSCKLLPVVSKWIHDNFLAYALSSEVIGKAMIHTLKNNYSEKLRILLGLAKEAQLGEEFSRSKLLAKCVGIAVTNNRSDCLKILFDAGLSIESASTIEKVKQLAREKKARDVLLLMETLYESVSM